MNPQKILDRLFKELLAAVALFGMLAVILVIYRQGLRVPAAGSASTLLDEDQWYEVRNEAAGVILDSSPKALIVYDAKETASCDLKENISYVMNSLYVNTDYMDVRQDGDRNTQDASDAETEEDAEEDELPQDEDEQEAENIQIERSLLELPLADYQDLIICISDLTFFYVDMDELGEWVDAGGHVLFTEPLEPNEYLLPWYELLGMENKDEVQQGYAESMVFETELLAGAKGMEFSDDVIAGMVLAPELKKECLIHITTRDEGELPLLWEYEYGQGKVIVCNADIMASKVDRGIVAASYCQFYPAYVYPVINAAVYCIDDFPSPAPAGYESNVLAQYGYTVADFYANVWMPAMQEISEKYNVRFSTFTIQTYENDINGPFSNTDNWESASYYANLVLNMGGEIGIHGYNHQPLVTSDYQLDAENDGYTPWENIRAMINSLKAAVTYTESLCDDLNVESYVAPSNVISPEALQEMLAQLEDIRVYAGVYSGTPDQFIQEYSVQENGVVYCPRLTADMQMEDSECWTQINELNFHYIESNFIHPDDILDENRSDGGDFSQMLAGYEEMIEWNTAQGLRVTTISEAAAAVQRYANLSIEQQLDDTSLTIYATGLIDEAYMMLRTNGKRPTAISNGTITQLAEDIYLLNIVSDTTVITMVDKS